MTTVLESGNNVMRTTITYYTVKDIAVEGTRMTLTMIDGVARYALARLSQ